MKEGKARLIPFGALLLSLLLSEPPSMLLMAIGAIGLHEFGHTLTFFLLTGALPSLSLDRFGLRLMPPRPLLPHEELLVALGGPLFNLFWGIVFCKMRGDFFFSLGVMHFLFALFNLLPYEDSDGGRVFRLIFMRFLGQRRGLAASIFLSALVLSFFYFLCLYVFYFTGEGLSGVFFAIFSFPWHHLEHTSDF